MDDNGAKLHDDFSTLIEKMTERLGSARTIKILRRTTTIMVQQAREVGHHPPRTPMTEPRS